MFLSKTGSVAATVVVLTCLATAIHVYSSGDKLSVDEPFEVAEGPELTPVLEVVRTEKGTIGVFMFDATKGLQGLQLLLISSDRKSSKSLSLGYGLAGMPVVSGNTISFLITGNMKLSARISSRADPRVKSRLLSAILAPASASWPIV